MKKEKGKTKSEKVWTSLLFTLSLILFTSAAQAADVKPVLRAENVRVEQRFPWTNLVDVCFTINNTLESAKNTNVIAQVRAFYDESKALGVHQSEPHPETHHRRRRGQRRAPAGAGARPENQKSHQCNFSGRRAQ